ncbi:hypothetical protein K0V43_19630, partial [Leptospira sp. id769339]|nr:hypothetical protein [Leptospira sp. id769339]
VYVAYKSVNYPKHLHTLEMGMLTLFTNEFSRLEILEKARSYSEEIPKFIFESREFRISIFYQALDLLKDDSCEFVERTGPIPDESGFIGKSPTWVWLVYDEEGIKEKIRLHYVNAFYLAEEYFQKVGLPSGMKFIKSEDESLLISPTIKREGMDAYIGVTILRVKVLEGEKFSKYQYLEIEEKMLTDLESSAYRIEIQGRLCQIETIRRNYHIPIFNLMPCRSFLHEILKDFAANYFR